MARAMAFIDGENLVARYQATAKTRTPREIANRLAYLKDVYVWQQASFDYKAHELIRATYYTYAVGDDDKVSEIEEAIKELIVRSNHGPQNLYPRVFKKPKQSAKAKGVDIQMTVDILTNTHLNNLDIVYLLSGDGDYIPLIEQVMRMGKRVYIAAFSSGLNPKLRTVADGFTLLDELYFE